MIDFFLYCAQYVFLFLGAAAIFSAALGLLRLENGPQRLHVTNMASTFGLGFLLLASALRHAHHSSSAWDFLLSREWLLLALVFLVSPLSAQVLLFAENNNKNK